MSCMGAIPSKLHGPMMKHGLVGLDVLNIAVHLTAAMLAGSHPDTPFDGECLLTMPYGEQKNGNGDVNSTDLRVAVGSLDLLEEPVQWSFMDTAAAVSAGGRAPEEDSRPSVASRTWKVRPCDHESPVHSANQP